MADNDYNINHVTENDDSGSDSGDDSVTEVDPTVFETVELSIPETGVKSLKIETANPNLEMTLSEDPTVTVENVIPETDVIVKKSPTKTGSSPAKRKKKEN